MIKYQIYCTQIKIHQSGCLHSPSWAAVQRQRAANLLLVLVAKKPLQSREPPDLSRPFSLDQGHIEIVPQLMVHVCPEVSNPKPWAASTPWNFPLMVPCAPSIFTDPSCINVFLDPFHLKHVERLPFWFLVLKLQQNPFFHGSLQMFHIFGCQFWSFSKVIYFVLWAEFLMLWQIYKTMCTQELIGHRSIRFPRKSYKHEKGAERFQK